MPGPTCSFLQRFLLLLGYLCFTVQTAAAGEALRSLDEMDLSLDEEPPAHTSDKPNVCHPLRFFITPKMAVESHTSITNSLQKTAQWLDRFFGDPRQDETLASSELRLSWNNEFVESYTGNTRLNLRGNLYLPSLQNRLQLVFEGEPDQNDLSGLENKNASSALRYTFLRNAVKTLNLDLGMRGGLLDPRIFTRLWMRREKQTEKNLHRITPSLGHDSGEGWEADLRFDNEYYIFTDTFLRSTTRPRWQEKVNGLAFDQNLSLYQRLSPLRYIALDWLNTFSYDTHRGYWDITRFRVRHRRNLWQHQLFLQVAPGVRFAEEVSHRMQWEFSISLEVVFSP